MTFNDLSDYDLDLIKFMAVKMISQTKIFSRYEALVNSTLDCLHSKGYNLEPEYQNLTAVLIAAVTPLTKSQNKSPEQIIEDVFDKLTNRNIQIVKDETRESTWSNLKNIEFSQNETYKKPWIF